MGQSVEILQKVELRVGELAELHLGFVAEAELVHERGEVRKVCTIASIKRRSI